MELAFMYDHFDRARETISMLNELQNKVKFDVEYIEVCKKQNSEIQDKGLRPISPHEFYYNLNKEKNTPNSLFDYDDKSNEEKDRPLNYHLVVVRLKDDSYTETIEKIMWSSSGVKSDKPVTWHYKRATKALVMASNSTQFMEVLSDINHTSDDSIHGGKYGQ